MLKIRIALVAILVTCVAMTSCEQLQRLLAPELPTDEGMMPVPELDEILATYKSWRYAQPLPAPPATFTEAKDSGSAHGLGDRAVYIDLRDHQFFYTVPAAIDAGIPVVYPTGMALAKEIMDDTNSFVWRVAVMKKTDDMMYADHNGWMYAQYQRDSEMDAFVAKAGDGTEKGSAGCHGCHSQAAHDGVFVTELLLELGRARLEALQSGAANTSGDATVDEDDTTEN